MQPSATRITWPTASEAHFLDVLKNVFDGSQPDQPHIHSRDEE